MMELVNSLCFKGHYHIHDLPELIALQRFYLASIAGIRTNSSEYAEHNVGVECGLTTFSSNISDIPSFCINEQKKLFIATWSFSEIPLHLRNEWITVLNRFSYFLFAYQNNHADIDNEKWFTEYKNTRPELCWQEEKISFNSGSTYLFAMGRGSE